jgi:protein MpaA
MFVAMSKLLRRCLPALALLLSTAAVAAAPAATPQQWCAAIGHRLGSVPPALCQKLQFQAAPVQSVNRNALMFRDLPPAPRKIASIGAAPKPPLRILLVGGIHGDELTSASIVFRWLQWIEEADSAQHHWRVIPVANPDGLLGSPPQRMNANGVDLNRNFPTPDWHRDAHAYWASKTKRDPRRFPGKEAASEPETRWLNEQIESFKPDLIVSVHAPYGILDFDGPARQPRRFGSLSLNRLGIYPGSLGNYGGVHKNMPVITIELPHATVMPSLSDQREIWEDMLTWIRRNLPGKNVS